MKSLHGFLVTSLFAISFLVSLIENAPVANSQSFNAAEEDIKQLIVMIDAKLGRESVIGSGVIVGVGANSLYMITADHVVRRGEQEAEEIQVKFRWRPNRQFKAKLLRHRDRELDLAILTVPGLEDLGANLDAMPFDRVGNLGSLKRGDAIYLLGHPGGRPWRVNTTPERLAQTNANTLEFESNLIAPGHSGGALLSEQRDLIGMLRSDNAPYGEAISITKVIERLNEWEYPVDLDRRNIPTSFSTVSVGMDRACAITGSGIAYCWGQIGTYYERGYYRDSISRFGLKRFAPSPTRTKGGLTFRAISVGSVHACAITMEYKAYCWGSNRNFQLGNGTTLDSEDPMPVAHNLSFQTISAGRTVTCGVTTDAGVYCWGTIDRTVSTSPPPPCSHGMPCYPEPVRMAGGLLFRKVAVHQSYAGDDKILGITEEGILYELSYSFPDSPRAISSNIIFGDLSGRCALDSTGVAYCVELYVSVKDATRLSDFARVKIPDDIP